MHNTTIESNELYENGRKKKMSKCNARVYYNKTEKKYYLETEYSEYCNNKVKEKYNNNADLNAAINNYKKFKDELIKFLNLNPIIKYMILKKKQQNYTIKIIANSKYWKILSKIFIITWEQILIKFAIFNWSKTLDEKDYFREYKYALLYNNSGKKLFPHEHIIYCSNYFIKKLRNVKLWYIDDTWIYPNGFKQLIIILYYDEIGKKRFPVLYALVNNKTLEGYLELFKKIKAKITIENRKKLNLESYSTYYEISLLTALKTIFKDVKQIDCYFHFSKNIRKNAIKYKVINNKDNKSN